MQNPYSENQLVAQPVIALLKVLDWRKQQQLCAKAKHTVQTILDEGLPDCYTEKLFGQISEAVYLHVYDSYYGEGKSIYTEFQN